MLASAQLGSPAEVAVASAESALPCSPSGGAVAAGGAFLRACSLPSCGRKEAAPLDFRVCALCNAVAYCCEAHSASHWRAGHRRACEALVKASPGQVKSSVKASKCDKVGAGQAAAGSTPTPAGCATAGEGAAQPGSEAAHATVAGAPSPPLGDPARPPPSPEETAALRALVQMHMGKLLLRRWGRAVELAGQAADEAFRQVRRGSGDVAASLLLVRRRRVRQTQGHTTPFA